MTNTTIMEEKMMKEWGLCEMNSSELLLRGGATKTVFATVFEKIRNLFDFLGDYIPSLINGLKDGFFGKSFI